MENKEDLILNGVSINQLKEQKKLIQKDASKLIAEKLTEVQSLFEQLKQSETKEQAREIASKMVELLEVVEIVAGVSGVSFRLPYYEEYGNYDNDEIISMFLEDSDEDAFEWGYGEDDPLQLLYSLAEGMESDSRGWYSSRC